MTGSLSVADVTSYVAATGWVRRPEGWRGATVWVHDGDHEILVPGSDDLADTPRRLREILTVLAKVEERSREDIASDIGAPMADVQWYRAPIVPQDGQFGLVDAVTAFSSAQAALGAAARAALTGPRAVFDGAAPRPVRDLLARVRIGPIVPSGDLLTVRVPLDRADQGEPPLARRTLIVLQRATTLLREAGDEARRTGDISVFDRVVGDGVSADLCAALARFAGADPGARFEVGFRWARGLPSAEPARTVVFEAETGRLLRRVAHRLRRLHREHASVTGLIGTLFDNGGEDRFRIHVRGEVSLAGGEPRSSLWVRLPGEAAYDVAVEAHRTRTPVRAHGTLMEVHGRLELMADRFARVVDDRSEET
ncbi:hypothetical protein E1286_43435 [Nonomuraea terrae]|uniref:Uncharacterized protein n=1 Tax=Nonomuraea terrae TaxID=2530383 RepID=A0A4R4XNG0_9ACTN|nr:hypothetical protein [Nonomuraea terrae]TDD32575.1 hypothetical protein E1286_43435 [Nonomuraea terrae]